MNNATVLRHHSAVISTRLVFYGRNYDVTAQALQRRSNARVTSPLLGHHHCWMPDFWHNQLASSPRLGSGEPLHCEKGVGRNPLPWPSMGWWNMSSNSQGQGHKHFFFVFRKGEGKTAAAHVAYTKEFLLLEDVQRDRRFSDGLKWIDAKVALCMPVVKPDGDCYAVLELYKTVAETYNDVRVFDIRYLFLNY